MNWRPSTVSLVLIFTMAGCASGISLPGFQSATSGGDEMYEVYKISLQDAVIISEKILKKRRLEIKTSQTDKRSREIFATRGGAKVTVLLEPVGPATKITVTAKKYRVLTDLETAQAILREIGAVIEPPAPVQPGGTRPKASPAAPTSVPTM